MIVMGPLVNVVYDLLGLYKLAIFVFIVMSWFEAFDIVNRHNSFVYGLRAFLQSIVEPPLYQIRKLVPPIGGWDLSPIVLIFVVYFVQGVLIEILKRFPS